MLLLQLRFTDQDPEQKDNIQFGPTTCSINNPRQKTYHICHQTKAQCFDQ